MENVYLCSFLESCKYSEYHLRQILASSSTHVAYASVQPYEGSVASTPHSFHHCLPRGKSSEAKRTLRMNYSLLFAASLHPVNSSSTPGGHPVPAGCKAASTQKSSHSRNTKVLLPSSLCAEAPLTTPAG